MTDTMPVSNMGASLAMPPVAGATPPAQAPAPLDHTVVALAKAIFQHESGTDFTKFGDNGTSYGAGQWNNGGKPIPAGGTPANWQSAAKTILGDANAPMTPANQKAVAYAQILQDKHNGLNPAQIAAKWNSGSPDNWEKKIGTTNINGKQIEYNVPKYVKSVTDLYQQYKGGISTPTDATATPAPAAQPSIAEQRAQREAQGLPLSVNENKAAPSFFGNIIRGAISPIVRLGNTAVEGVQKLAGVDTHAQEYNPYLGDISGLGMKEGQTTGQRVKDVIGGLANVGADLVGGEGAGGVIEAGLGGLLKQGVKTGLKEGAIAGAASGFGNAMQNNEGVVDTLKDTAINATGGAVTGGAFGAVAPVLGAVKNAAFGAEKSVGQSAAEKLANNPIVKKRTATIQQLGDNYASVGRVINKAKADGIDLPTTLASTDLLHDVVDNTGTIRTKGSIDELNAFLKDGPEKVVSKNLDQEGVKIPISDVQARLNKDVNESTLTGSSKVTALNNVKKEVAGLRLDTDKDGNISLSKIHQAKVNKYANVNYLNPESGTADKLVAKSLKNIVEENTKSVSVQNLNKELAQHYAVLNLLEKLNGKKVQGGKLGKYFAQTVGGIVGSHFGPLGTIAGAEIGGAIKGKALSSVFGGKIGTDLASSDAMKAAIESGNKPKSISLPVKHVPSAYASPYQGYVPQDQLPTIKFGKPTLPKLKAR